MEAPSVRYVTTGDGVRIAYTACGAGPPLVLLTEPTLSHVELEWSQPVVGAILSRLAERTQLVRLDVRGTGLSDRVSEPGSEPVLGEVRAVTEKLGISRFALVGVHALAPAAIVYASMHPDKVTHLVLVDPVLRIIDMVTSPQLSAVITAAQADWTIASEVIGAHVFGLGRPETKAFGSYVRACIGPEFYGVALRATSILDATSAAATVGVPTFIVRHEGHPYITANIVREVAASIPDAEMVTTPGLWADDTDGLTGRVLNWMLNR